MSTADVLSSQREEITRCAARRETLLRTLFGATQSYLRIAEPSDDESLDAEKQERELTAFLDSNDIHQNRFFDLSTLPSPRNARIPQYNYRRPSDPVEQKSALTHGNKPFTNHDRQVPRQHSEGPEGERRLRGRTVNDCNPPSTLGDSNRLPDLHSIPPNSVDGYVDGDDGKLDVEKKLGPSTGTKASSTDSHEHTVDSERLPNEISRPREDASQHMGRRKDERPKNLTPPDSGRSTYGTKDEPNGDRSSRRQEMPLQGGDTPTTPEEHPRLEGAQSMQKPTALVDGGRARAPSTANSADLPSRFIQDAYDEGNTIMDIPPLGDDMSRHQQSAPPIDQHSPTQRPNSGMRNSIFTSMNGDVSKDPTFSRRPPMRIDTGVHPLINDSTASGGKTTVPMFETATPSKTVPLSSGAQSPPERMTRISSGALRHKSVSEILGETPKTASPAERGVHEATKSDQTNLQSPKSASSAVSPDISAFRLRLSELKDKERSKLSTVVFAKQQTSGGSRSSDNNQSQQPADDLKPTEPRDYFLTFFAAQVFQSPRATPLSALLRQAHKPLSTSDHYIELREKQDFKILNQIKDMQHYGRWSLRQPERAIEPQRSATHWDVLLGQIKWMRTDFREERKFKLAGAKYLAGACATWVSASSDDRRSLQVKVRRPSPQVGHDSQAATPDLVHDETSELAEDETPVVEVTASDPPAAIFSLPPDVFVFGLTESPVAEKILLELPCYNPAKDIQDAALRTADANPDATWKTPLVPVSRYAHGKLESMEEGPPRKRPRLDVSDATLAPMEHDQDKAVALPPADESVALFNPDNKHIRDRIHAGHAFRPPSEHQMPSREFFECRSPSQWTLAEDDELRKLVREFSYNWSLISSCLSSPSMYSSGAERRTPWECFERWISLEGLPAEMSKVPYFRTYHQRLQQAARAYEARQQALIQQQGGNPAQLPLRRRSNQPYTVEKRKSNKPLHLVDAMRKHAKKKEAALHKQQQQATLGAMRKNNEAPKDRKVIPSAREMSRMKHEKQMKLEEQNRLLRMQYANTQNMKKAAQQHANPQVNGNITNRNGASGMPNGGNSTSAGVAPQLRGAGQDPTRAAPQMQRMMNGTVAGGGPGGQGVPNAPMQPQIQVPTTQRVPPQMTNDVRLFQEAQRVQAEQAYLQQRQQQRHSQQNGHAGSPNMQSINPLPQNNPAMLASMQGRSSPSLNGAQTTPGNSASPRLNQPQPQALSSGMTPAVNQIQNQVKIRNPGASPGEVQRLTTEHLVRMSQQHTLNQQAMVAAVGNSGGGLAAMQAPNPMLQHQQAMLANGNASMYNQQQYAAYMRAQQANQQRTGSAGNGVAPGIGGSRSVTPMLQRTGSAQGGGPPRGPSQSPRPGPVGVAGAP